MESAGDTTFKETCSCGRTFYFPGALKNHQRSCAKTKKRLASALGKAKDLWTSRKRKRLNIVGPQQVQSHAEQPATELFVDPGDSIGPESMHLGEHGMAPSGSSRMIEAPSSSTGLDEPQSQAQQYIHNDQDDAHLSLAERRPRRLITFPMRFRDVLPQPLPPLLDTQSDQPRPLISPPTSTTAASSSITSRILKLFRTPQNAFGLFRQYYLEKPPSHDPEEHIELQDLSDSPPDTSSDPPPNENMFYPYPNKNSFLLGDWHWNYGIQKSRESFSDLLSIVGSLDFKPEDVRHTPWAKIDAKLASNKEVDVKCIAEDGTAEWMDEDAGWKRSMIRISVPFHSRAKNPGPKDYVVGELYHRSIVSIIREKLSNPHEDRLFHYEPFELFWRRPHHDDQHIHGELYTSAAFIDAHRENAFSNKLSPLGFNLYPALVVDFMHEFELGVWKALFIHLLRMLNAVDKSLVDELDRRSGSNPHLICGIGSFRQVPTFGGDTIRRFVNNVSELKRLAARDFADLLQIGSEFRTFNKRTCPAFDTKELRREADARKRQQAKRGSANGPPKSSKSKPSGSNSTETAADGQLSKTLNIDTYKHHCLGDYPRAIRQYGTMDSISTEPGELEHRAPKARYKRTDRHPKRFIKQLAQIERRQARIRQIRARTASHRPREHVASTPQEHHHISVSQNDHEHIGTFLRDNTGDPAIQYDGGNVAPDPQNLLPKLKRHLLSRVLPTLQRDDTPDIDQSECDPGAVLMVDYQPRRMDFVWVRWYQNTGVVPNGWRDDKLDCIKFPSINQDDSFGFVDPADVLRGCHIIPRFSGGKVHADGKGLSRLAGDAKDWTRYYVNRFVDRDMIMRYHVGRGVGHTTQAVGGSESGNSPTSQEHGSEEEECNSELDEGYEAGDREATSEDDSSSSGSIDGGSSEEDTDEENDEELLAMEEMYGY
ncbi:hypothetical protein PILCRDRAFT_90994 [Piloderma croceum F 1598]|uniref:Uncharacterized protein n=1 Tax=Piloderma croceum (strain F 1598) TaxID=765440 RepID=A0A0C3AUT8_PILCF|nr:hypothetical protein PILCRDRAFT_90994 [Piloderma croceum F 1598]